MVSAMMVSKAAGVQLNLKVVNAFLGAARAGVSGRGERKITDGRQTRGADGQGTHTRVSWSARAPGRDITRVGV
jgi:hypothetical protein